MSSSETEQSSEKTIESTQKKIYIKYFLIGDIDTSKIITEYSTNLITSKEKKNAIQIFKRLCKSSERRYEENNIITSKDDKYYFSLYQPSTAFISYAINSYPQKLIFELFEEVKNKNILSMLNEETKDLDSKGRQELKQIIEKYQENEKMKRFEEIKKDINDVKISVKNNINKMIDSVESVENLEEKISELNDDTKEYLEYAQYDKKIAWYQSAKFRIIFLTIIICLAVTFLWYVI